MQKLTQNIDEYIADFPKETQLILEQIRATIRKSASEAEETISYRMPAYKQNGVLVYFAACKNHIGFYPTASGIANFKAELSGYKSSKGAVQFPIENPIPLDLIAKIVQFRVKENLNKSSKKTK